MSDTYERIVAVDSDVGLYESNYLKANAPDGSGAFWIKHNVLTTGGAMPPVAEFWLVVWRRDWRPVVSKRVMPLDRVDLSSENVAIHSDVATLTPGGAHGRFADDIRWNLEIHDTLPAFRHFASDWMYEAGFPRKKVVTGSPRAIFDGSIHLPDGEVPVREWIGHRNHNWGTEHALRYAYGGCCLWPDGPTDLTVEGFTVQVRLAGRLRSPWTTVVGGLRRGEPYGARTLPGALRSVGEVRWPEWVASSPTEVGRARLAMRLDPEHTAGLRYLHPDGTVSYCYNAKDAEVRLQLDGEVHHSPFGELEFLFPEPIPGIELHGHASLDELREAASSRS